MKIHFERTGGFAGPAARKSCDIDVNSLPPDEARRARQLVSAANLAGLSSARATPFAAAGRDMFQYRITVEHAGARHEVNLSETEATGPVRDLINWLKERAGPGPREPSA
jgi:hypothetical protein